VLTATPETRRAGAGALTQDPRHSEAYLVTTRPVKAGEELTQNYLEFETKEDLKRRGISQ